MKNTLILFAMLLMIFRIYATDSAEEGKKDESEVELKISTYSILMFPVNIGPDIVSNTLCWTAVPFLLLYGCPNEPAWAVLSLTFIPLAGIFTGSVDALEGYFFWEPAVLRKEYVAPLELTPEKRD